MVQGKTVLLTGGTGFVGRHVAAALVREGAVVRCLVRSTSAFKHLEALGAELRFGSLDDAASLREACTACDVILHVAGATKVTREDDFLRVNRDGTRRLLDAAGHGGARPPFVLVSSLAACGPSRPGAPLVEADEPRPVSAYGRSKLAGEEVVRASALPWVITRPPVVYGPGDRDVYSFFRLASLHLAPRIGGGERTLSMMHVSDFAAGLIRAAAAPAGSTYFLSDPEPYRLCDVLETVADVMGKRVLPLRIPFLFVRLGAFLSEVFGKLTGKAVIFNRDKIRELRHAHWACRSDKAAAELGFRCSLGLTAGIKQTAAWYREAGWL